MAHYRTLMHDVNRIHFRSHNKDVFSLADELEVFLLLQSRFRARECDCLEFHASYFPSFMSLILVPCITADQKLQSSSFSLSIFIKPFSRCLPDSPFSDASSICPRYGVILGHFSAILSVNKFYILFYFFIHTQRFIASYVLISLVSSRP